LFPVPGFARLEFSFAESLPMRLAAPILAALLATSFPATAEAPNLAIPPKGTAGAATRLFLAQRTYQTAMESGDAVMLLTAIRLARAIVLRPPAGWSKTTTGKAPVDQPKGRSAAPDPATPQVLAIVQALAGEDTDLQDLVFDLDAQLPQGRKTSASAANSDLGGGQSDRWEIVLPGQVSAEFTLIGDGDSPLGLTVTDDGGAVVCALPPATEPGLCRFTPARNGFFTLDVRNTGNLWNTYRLIGS
jgi:hypothetical protein